MPYAQGVSERVKRATDYMRQTAEEAAMTKRHAVDGERKAETLRHIATVAERAASAAVADWKEAIDADRITAG